MFSSNSNANTQHNNNRNDLTSFKQFLDSNPENINDYITDISSYLKNWTFDRLSYIDQAILLESYSEIKSKINNKNIVIDEAIRIAKEYSNEDSYKYINGVLDNL